MSEKAITIGRDSSCDYIIIDPQKRVSRKHAKVIISNNKIGLIDLESTNGVYVNQTKIEPNKIISFISSLYCLQKDLLILVN